jgi:hypothetical protein
MRIPGGDDLKKQVKVKSKMKIHERNSPLLALFFGKLQQRAVFAKKYFVEQQRNETQCYQSDNSLSR